MKSSRAHRSQSGFTLLEMLIVVVILTVVFGIVLAGIADLQRHNASEVSKMDLTQESREFLDQITRDIHQAGYPSGKLYAPGAGANLQAVGQCPTAPTCSGLLSVAQDQIIFEGDTDGNGAVEKEIIQVVDNTGAYPPAGACPCTIQRGVVNKGAAGNPVYYTEVNNVTNKAPFAAYTSAGTAVALPATTQATLSTIKTIRVFLLVQSPNVDQLTSGANKIAPVVSMMAEAKLVN
jgi:prepilin-type N-terminal cleavage/methylation domain-containing protein